MAIGPFPVPNYTIAQPQDPLANYARVVSLKNMLAQQQQLPLDLQIKQQEAAQAQQATQQATIQTQIAQQQQASQAAMVKALSDPDFSKEIGTSGAGPSGNGLGFDPDAMTKALVSRGVLPQQALQFTTQLVQRSASVSEAAKNNAAATSDNIANYQKGLDAITQLIAPVMDMKAGDAAAAWPAVKQKISQIPGLPPQDVNVINGATLDQLPALSNFLGIEGRIADFHKQEADSLKAQQAADTVYQLSTPEALANPGAQAAITAKINDPSTKPEDIPRLQALLPKAAVAQRNAATLKARDELAEQQITQGDPNAAGALLASRALTIDELKLRNATPQFMEQAVMAAQKIDPTFKAAEASAQGKIAASPANQQFFGNTDSLLVRGGTLDQLQSAGSQLPAGQIPVFNRVSELASESVGNTPMSRYAAAVLGVADDYAKVMAGSQGSDTSRQQILDILKPAQSPQQLQAAIDQVRAQVSSQRNGRLGTNPYLRDMYPDPQATRNAAPAPQLTISAAQLEKAAKDHGISIDEARKQAQAANVQVTQ